MVKAVIKKLTGVQEDEFLPALLSFAYFFCILCAYYVLRPLREDMGLSVGVNNLPYLLVCTLLFTLIVSTRFSSLVSKVKRATFIPVSYYLFSGMLFLFYAAMSLVPEGYLIFLDVLFYVWLSVFNLFVVSIFWSFMADGFGLEKGKRLFAVIASGGTIGAITGAGITTFLLSVVGRLNLMLFSIFFLLLAVHIVKRLDKAFNRINTTDEFNPDQKDSLGSQMYKGISLTLNSPYLMGISLYLLLYSFLSTFLYFEQATIVAEAFETRAQRTEIFALVDFWTNILTLFLQLFVTGHILRELGVMVVLVTLPILTALGFISLALSPVLVTLVIFQIVRRAGHYALARPAREILFTILGRDEKYRAKNFIDTFVYRTGDALSAGVQPILGIIGLGVTGVAWVAVPFAVLWTGIGVALGLKQHQLAEQHGKIKEQSL